MNPTPSDEQRAREIAELIQPEAADAVSVIVKALAQVRAEEREANIFAINNAAVNKFAKYTCCLENGLNARNICEKAIRGRGKK